MLKNMQGLMYAAEKKNKNNPQAKQPHQASHPKIHNGFKSISKAHTVTEDMKI